MSTEKVRGGRPPDWMPIFRDEIETACYKELMKAMNLHAKKFKGTILSSPMIYGTGGEVPNGDFNTLWNKTEEKL